MTMLDIKLKFAFKMICTYLPSPSFLGFTSIIEEFICGEGIHKSNSNAIISDFLCRAFYVVIPKYITNVASSIYLPCASHSNFLAYKWRKGSKEVRHDFIQMFGMIWKDCPGGRIFFFWFPGCYSSTHTQAFSHREKWTISPNMFTVQYVRQNSKTQLCQYHLWRPN